MDKSKWEYKKLGDICKSINAGGTPSRGNSAYWNGDIPWVKIKDMNSKYVNSTEEFITNEGLNNSSAKLFEPGTILYSIFATIGAASILEIPATTNQAIAGIVLGDGCNRDFYYYYLAFLKSHFENISKGVAQNNINLSVLRNQKVIVPPLDDQQRIVAELDCLNEMIALKQEQLKEFDKLAQSIFYDMFGDPISNEKGWEKNKLDELYKVTSSKRILQSEWQDNGVPFYKVADIVNLIDGKTVIPSTYIKESTYNELISLGLVPNSGDILITSRGTLGECYIVLEGDKFYFQDGMITWLSQKANNILPIYLKSVFGTKSFLDSLLHNANMSTVAYLSIGQLSKVLIPLPPLALQQQFAEKIQAIEAQKELVKQSIAETQQLLASRMDYYFD